MGKNTQRHNSLHADSQTVQVVQQQTYQGPIPHPSDLEKYELVIPGAAERILHMAEAENQHRHKQEEAALHKLT